MNNLFPWHVGGSPVGFRKLRLATQVVILNGLCLALYVAVVCGVLRLFGVI